MPRPVVAGHQFQTKLLGPVAGQRQANQPPAVGRHEVDDVGRGHLRGDHEIAFVLPVFIVDQNEHAAVAGLVDDFLDRDQYGLVIAVPQEAFKLAQRLGSRIPIRLRAISQGIGMQPGSPGQPSTRHSPIGRPGGGRDRLVQQTCPRHYHTGV